jgi:hypothetical protein
MPDSTIKKVEAASSPRGEMGQKYLVAGKRVSMRLWVLEPGSKVEAATSREYETVGYVISGRAKLDLEGQIKSEGRRFLAGSCRSHARVHDTRAIQGGRGHSPSRRGSRPR